ncbi:DUF1501 domain-containing protein [Novosphingobium sp.]|uniref:DUF1501 domain-containing protein n=1 Tax=Novosphingobium sp. TaxID=1874826 RepID=UPI0038F68BBA
MLLLDRRRLLAAGAATLLAPQIAYAKADSNRRLVFVIQRGAADGLAILAPTGDPAYAALRGDLARDLADLPKLSGMFALHPVLKQVGAMFGVKQALFAHAVASPYRDRSHFDAQNVLETGSALPYERPDGWMNRLLALLPGGSARGLAIAATIPTALRGPVQVSSYAPLPCPMPRTISSRASGRCMLATHSFTRCGRKRCRPVPWRAILPAATSRARRPTASWSPRCLGAKAARGW